MTLDIVLFTVLHLLVFAYWLGGDLGAFYSSFIVADPQRSAEARGIAAHILLNVDMAPRAGLIFALPTGLALAVVKGWLPGVGWPIVTAAFALAAVWMALAVSIHTRHGPEARPFAAADRMLRVLFALALLGTAAAVAAGALPAPLFVGLKLGLLGFCVVLGLLVRSVLTPFGPAFGALVTSGATTEIDQTIARSLGRVRPLVMLIWACLLGAAALGVATPG